MSSYRTSVPFMTVHKITGNLPTEKVNIDHLNIPQHITLADPMFASPGHIDLLIGQEIFWDLLCIGQIKTKGCPTLQKTRLGWIVGGRIDASTSNSNSDLACCLTTTDKISSQLQNFWTIEEPLTTKHHLTSEEAACEDHYKLHTRRDTTGRYVVKMPMHENPSVLGDSKEIALKRLKQVEKRFVKDPELKSQYLAFMNEYIDLGHMEQEEEDMSSDQYNYKEGAPEYFLPHHPVIKTSSSTTKLRVVFDASAKTTTGRSLNDIQMVGPVVQSDLFSIMLRFRVHSYVMSADLEKMYRQILIDESQRSLLKIVWRDDPSLPVKTFILKTVTYGTASAPYLATNTLNRLMADEGAEFPVASEVVRRDFYVDDLLTGSSTIEEGLVLQKQLINLLSRDNFNLRKWNANTDAFLSHLPRELLERKPQEFSADSDKSAKTLGLWWDAEQDAFLFKYSPTDRKNNSAVTKRIVLSEIARLFDPLGLVSPIIIRAKMLLQELWKMKLEWDESLPTHMHTQWSILVSCLCQLNELRIPRQVTLPCPSGLLEIHGFSDASERGYGGTVYLRRSGENGIIKSQLLCSKSRVAPLHSTSLPRLELCAALLLAELMSNVEKALHIKPELIGYWTDSTIALAWIKAEPARWTTFVANRVAKIQTLTHNRMWRHVNTGQNPADLVSRGVRTPDLKTSDLWWSGPTWLGQDKAKWPSSEVNLTEDLPEKKATRITACVAANSQEHTDDAVNKMIGRFSSYSKLLRVTAWCLRFVNNLKNPKHRCKFGYITTEELQGARNIIMKTIQKQHFSKELKELSAGCTPSKPTNALAPFLDKSGLIRVGGRIPNSALSYDAKHPILLPRKHNIAEMIAREEHIRQLHCGPQTLLYAVRQQYWPINGRELTRRIVHQCVRCFRAKPKSCDQLMGDLPPDRTNPARPFVHTGVDYCGPFYTKQTKRRNASSNKSYIAVFICLSTKALHLELVSDLTTDCFLAALRRFVSRRGLCTSITSDNGKTFVGAKREMGELHAFLKTEASAIIAASQIKGIDWRFIPPYSPHMGGIWEAAVKSLKHHLRRIVGKASLTFEELTTVVTQVEAVLNSRPLTPISNDPNDLSVLTPAHFLTGGSLTALPEPSLTHLQDRCLSRWQRLQQLLQHFWARWSKEYLNTLQQRGKWRVSNQRLQVNTLVLLKEDNAPPLSWPMGRIITVHPGKDNIVRVVTVKTASGCVKRSVAKLCPLPIET